MGDATSSLDNAAGVTREQGLRPRRQVHWLPLQSGPLHIQLWPSRGSSSIEEGNNLDGPSHKCIINLSSTPLRSLLAKGPNYAIAPRHPPNLGYITAIESVCPKLSQQDVEELRPDVNKVLRGSYPQT